MKRSLLNTLCLLIVGSFASLGVRADALFLRYAPLLSVTSSPEPKAVLEDGGRTLRLVYDSEVYGEEDADWFPIREGSLDVGVGSRTGILYGHMRELDAYLYAYAIERIVVDSTFAGYQSTLAYGWFAGFPGLKTVEGLSNFNLSNIRSLAYMFCNCSKLEELDVSALDTSNITSMEYMFNNCSLLTTIYASAGFTTARVSSSANMFNGCSKLTGGAGTRYSSSYVSDGSYARIDEPGVPGYFTAKSGLSSYDVLYVNQATGSDSYDGITASRPKKTIQSAIAVVSAGGRIYVAPGVYGPIVTANRSATISSWRPNGGEAEVVIDGRGSSRCAYLGDSRDECNTILRGFVLRNGAAQASGFGGVGAGVRGGTVVGCVISNCTAAVDAGGASDSVLENCLLCNNSANNVDGSCRGFALARSVAFNCTVTRNSGSRGAAVCATELYNCIVSGNGQDIYTGTDAPPCNVCSCFSGDPAFVDVGHGNYRLTLDSPCVDAGSNAFVRVLSTVDLDGRPRIVGASVDIGCYEQQTVRPDSGGDGTCTDEDLLRALDYERETVLNGGQPSRWTVDTSENNFGGTSVRTAQIGNSQSTEFTMTVAGSGLLTFDWKVESEQRYDWLECHIDGRKKKKVSGSVGWETVSCFIPAEGEHEIKWLYCKDSSSSRGRDCGWIDHVVWDPGATDPHPGVYSELVGDVEWFYTVSNGLASVGSGRPDLTAVRPDQTGSISMPSSLGGYPVRGIGDYAFYRCQSLEGVSIANGVTRIGNDAFEECRGLRVVTIPNSVVDLGTNVFSMCETIETITIPATVKSCGVNAVSGCSKLQEIVLYAPLGNVLAFSGCPRLETIRYYGSTRLPDRPFGDSPSGATLYVLRDTADWDCAIPGTWCGLRIDYLDGLLRRQLDAMDFTDEGELEADGVRFWRIDTAISAKGGSSLRSAKIGDSQSTFVTLRLQGKGVLSFKWKVSSEGNYDWLSFFVDGTQVSRISGSQDWAKVEYEILTEGSHEIKWQYSKDGSSSRDSDSGWIDAVSWNTDVVMTLGTDVLLWAPSVNSGNQVGVLVPKLCNVLRTAYAESIPNDSRFASNYADGVRVAEVVGTTSIPADLPGTLADYALVFVVLPYNQITERQVARLKTVVDRGGRVVLQAEHALFSATENARLTKLAADMGADFSILTGQKAGADTYNTGCNLLSKPTLLTELPESKSVAPISYWGVAQEVARLSNDSSFVWAIDEASGNGRITVFSDNNWYCDSGTSSGTLYEDAIPLLERLLSNAIENEQKVMDEEDPNADIEENVPDWAVAAVRDDNNLLTYYSNVVSACTAASSGRAVTNRLTVVLKKDVAEDFLLPEGVTFETTGITTSYAGEISVPSGCELVVNATHDVYKSVSVHPPEAPTVTASQGAYTNKVEISWTVPDSEKTITAYEVKRVSSGGLETVLSTSVTGTSYGDTSARSGVHYTYYVRAQSSAGWGFAGTAEGWRSADGQAPDPVLEVTVTAGTETNGVIVTWQPDTNSAIEVTHYQVRRAPKGTDDWTTLTSSVDPSATSYTDSGAEGGVEYDYQVRAGNDNGWSSGVRSGDSGWIPVVLSLDPSYLAVPVEGGTQMVSVVANVGWTVASVDGNVTPVVTNGTTLTIDVPANLSQSARTNTVTVTAGTDHPIVATLTVVQARQPKLTDLEVFGPDALEGGSASNFVAIATYDDGTKLNVTSNVTWLAEPPLNGAITSNGVFTAVEFVDSNRFSSVSAVLTQVGDETVTLTNSVEVTILPVVWDTYEQVVNPNFETDFTFTRGINPDGGVAVFVDTNEPVEGNTRAIVAGTPYTIKWPDGFKYYDGKTYDLYFKMIPRNSANPWSWAFEFKVIDGKECILGPGSLVANKNFDMEVWLQDGEKAVTDIDLIGGSCYTGYEEGARPYSDNGKIYTNVPNPSSFWRWDPAESCWSPSSGAYDTPNYFILGHGTTPEGHLKGGYKGHPGSCGGEFVFGYITKDVTFRAEYADGASAPAKFSYETNTAVFAGNVLRIPLDRRISVLPTVELPHQHVDHWYLGSDRTKPLTSEALRDVCVTDNLTVTAVMMTNQFAITFSPADDSRDETVNGRPFVPTDVVVTYGAGVSGVPQVEKPYARLLGWSTNMTVSVPEHPLSNLSGLATLADEHDAKVVLYSIWVPYYPVSLWLEGPTHGAVDVAEEYHAFAAFADATTNEVTLDASTTWSVMPTNKSTCVKTKSAFELTPRAPDVTLVLSATYIYGTNTVSGSLAVTVPEIVTLPVALDIDAVTNVLPLATGATDGVGNVWYGQTNETHDAVDAARSGWISGAGKSWMSTTVTNAGDISFWWKTSCEPTYDNLSFAVDGVVKAQTSGTTNDWRQLKFEIPGGTHTLRWAYAKDGKNDVGQDCGWVDQLVWEPLPPPLAPTGDASVISIRASDGTSADYIEVEWSPFDSRRPILGYELSRAVKGSGDWTVLSTNGVLRYVDKAEPGVDYTYRVRARNDAGWGEWISDNGWRAYSLCVGPTEVSSGCNASTNSLSVSANAEWNVAVAGGSWLTAERASETNATLAVEANDSLDARTGTVTVSVGGDSPHAISRTVTVTQQGRPPVIDVGFVKPYEEWRTRLQVTTNLEDNAYAPVSVFSAADPLEIGFGWTNRSEIAVSVPSVRFLLYVPDVAEPVAEWTVEGRAGEVLDPGEGAWSGGWPFEVLAALRPGDYRLEAELAPDMPDLNREGDLDSDENDNIAIFRFAVRNVALDAFRDVFAEFDFTNVEFMVGNDFAQEPHAANRDATCTWTGGTSHVTGVLPSIQFGPYVPMNGTIGRTVRGKAPLDLVFLIDVTGSMSGCINGLKANIREFFKTLVEGDADHAPITDWRAKVIGYRDETCDYSWYEDHGFTTDVGAFNSHIAACVATGGGDTPESLLDAVWRISKETQFREDASRAIVAFTDAPSLVCMSYGSAAGKGCDEAAQAVRDAGIVLHVVSSDSERYAYYNGLFSSKLVEKVNALTGGTNSTYKYVGSLSTTSLNADMLSGLAKTVSSGVKEAKVVEPMLSCSTRGYGTLSFDWKNDATDGTNNTFRFECASVTNIANEAGTGWQHVELELKEGWHLFQWTYGKRDYRGLVSDCGVVANLTWEPYATKLDIQPATLPADYNGLALPPYNVTVTNFDGKVVTSNDYCVAYSNREEQVDSVGGAANTIFTYGGKFKVDCNSCWKVVEADDWLKPIVGEGDGNGELIVEIGENMSYAQRTGFITVRAGEYGLPSDLILEKTVKVVQERHPYIPGPDPQILTVDVKPRWPWSEIVDIDFEVILPQSGKPVSATFRGLNLEGGDVRKNYGQMEGSRKSYADPKYDGTLWGATVGKNDVTANCPSSGIYRVSWNMAKSGTWESSDYWGTKGDSFHTPEFAVALKAAADGCMVQNATSRTVRVDLRQDLCGGRIISGTERIGHPTGYIDPVVCDSTSMSNGWNCLDAYYVTGEGDATTNYLDDAFTAQDNNKTGHTNRFDRACVINDAYVEGGLIVTNTVWRPDRVHIVRDNVYVDPSATLTIADGTIVKFCRATRLFIHKFKSSSYNLVVQGAYFTVAQDAYYGGDTLHLNAQTRDNSGWDLGQGYVVSQNMIYTSELNANASSPGGHAIASVTLYCPPIDPMTGKYGEDSYKSTDENRESKAYAVRYYTRGQQWGCLPRPTTTGTEFYGWFNDSNGLTANWLNTDGYVDRTKYPSAVAMHAVEGEKEMDFTANFNTTIYGLVLDTDYFGSAGNLCPRSNAGGGQIVLSPECGVYDGKTHSPAIRSFTVADANVPASTYVPAYGPGNFTTAGVYAVSAEFRSDYTNAPTVSFAIEPRPIEGGEIRFSDPTNGVMYLPGLKKPTVTVHLPEYRGSEIDDSVATRDATNTHAIVFESTDPEDHDWPEVGDYRVVASYEGNPNYTGGALTNVFRVSVNPDYVFTEYDSLEEAKSHSTDGKYKGETPRIIRFSGRESDILLNSWKDLISGNTKLNDYVCEHFVCWADTTDGAPFIGVRSLKDDQRDIVTTNGVLTVAELLKFFRDAFVAPELPTDASGAVLTLSHSALAYDGTSRRPSVTVTLGGETIASGDYDLVWSGDGVDVGTYLVFARFDGNVYMGETEPVAYEVVPGALKTVTLDPESAEYDGAMHKPKVSTGGIVCTVDYGTSDFAAVGDYPITVTASGNYTGSVTKVFRILPKEIDEDTVSIELDAVTAEVKKSKSGGDDAVDVCPHILSVSDGTRTYVEGVDYDLSYSPSSKFTASGTYIITATFKGGYSGSVSVEVVVTEAVETDEEETVTIEGDGKAFVEKTAEGITIRPSEGVKSVTVNIPTGVDETKVTVEVSSAVESVKPNGATIRIIGCDGKTDITSLLHLPEPVSGVVDLTNAVVIDEAIEEILNPDVDGTSIDLGPNDPVLRTVTRKGLFYQLYEGRGLGAMTGGDSTIGDGGTWTPKISVKGGSSAFYRIDVAPREK